MFNANKTSSMASTFILNQNKKKRTRIQPILPDPSIKGNWVQIQPKNVFYQYLPALRIPAIQPYNMSLSKWYFLECSGPNNQQTLAGEFYNSLSRYYNNFIKKRKATIITTNLFFWNYFFAVLPALTRTRGMRRGKH